MSKKMVDLVARLGLGLLNFLKRKEVNNAKDNPANYLSDDDELRESDQSFADLSSKAKRHKAK